MRRRVAILSHGFWRDRFGGDPAIVGRDILLSNERFSVVGVMPAGFQFLERRRQPVGARRLQLPASWRGARTT